MLEFDIHKGNMTCPEMGLTFSDKPYLYKISGQIDGEPIVENSLVDKSIIQTQDEISVKGHFPKLSIEFIQKLSHVNHHLEEIIALRNASGRPITLNQIEFGFVADLNARPDWRLCAIPFRVQLDGSVHDYSTKAIIEGQFRNATYADKSRPDPLTDLGSLRSEAWAWGPADKGLLIIKYNNYAIELSVASPHKHSDTTVMRYGGVGFSLYCEPSTARHLARGGELTFGKTLFMPYEGGLIKAFNRYREYLDSKGHGFPDDYNPPVHWNELYDIGWYHSDPMDLRRHYNREALLREAEKGTHSDRDAVLGSCGRARWSNIRPTYG